MTLDELLSAIYDSNSEKITVRPGILKKGNPGGQGDSATVTISLDEKAFAFERDERTGTWKLIS